MAICQKEYNMTLKQKIQATAFERLTMSIKEFVEQYHRKIDCQPLGQRLPVTKTTGKKEGIIDTIKKQIDIGQITLVKNEDSAKYDYDSIDGGHRKRYIYDYVTNKFKIDGKYFNQITEEEQSAFLDYKLSFVIYEPLNKYTRGYIFRTLNETTEVNHMEMLNSFGDIPVANLIRNAVRVVPGIDNTVNELFELGSADGKFRYLDFNNERLKTEELLARMSYRYTQQTLLGSSSDDNLESMYEGSDINIDELTAKLNEHCKFLLKCANAKKTFNGGLRQQDFKMLSFLYFYMMDSYGKFKVEDYVEFMKAYRKAFLTISNKDGKYADIKVDFDFDNSARLIPEAFTKYLGAPHHEKKIKQTVIWLIEEFDYKKYVTIQDVKRAYTSTEKETRLAEQNWLCDIDGLPLSMSEAEAGHIESHSNGGRSTMDNMRMIRKSHNRAMGTMNLEVYKQHWLEQNKKAS